MSSAAQANPTGAAITLANQTKTNAIPHYAKAGTGVVGYFSTKTLLSPVIRLTLPDGRVVTARQTHMERMNEPASTTWSGAVIEAPGGHLLLTEYRGTITGVLHYDAVDYELRPARNGQHIFYAVDPARLPRMEPNLRETPLKVSVDLRKSGIVGHLSADQVPVVQDVFILYTGQSLAAYGKATLESSIVNAVASANEAYRNSGVGITLRLVGMRLSNEVIESSAGMITTLSNLATSTEAKQALEESQADMLLLVNQNNDWCGYAYVMGSPSASYASVAFGAVATNCLSQDMLAHEVGHIQGLMHDRETEPANGALPYGHGYRICSPGGFFDIMAYPCTSGTSVGRLRQFSNPKLYFNGQPTGISYETSPSLSADASRALNETAAIVAGYRGGGTVPPIAPVAPPARPKSLTGSSEGTTITLSWVDASSNEAGFKIQRDAGPTYVEIAQVGAGSTSYTDSTITPGATYSYTITAYNSGGVSAASNQVTVTAKVPLPSAPLSMTGGSDGTSAELVWLDTSSNETGFKLERSLDGRTYALLASLGANTESYSDRAVTRNKTYFYRVSAFNAAGSSTVSNAASVKIAAVPPGVPVGVTATNNRNGTMTLRWSKPSSGIATSFEVRRSSLVKKKKWRKPVAVGTVAGPGPASFVHTGVGTFRYSVRARNAAGYSSLSAPVQIEVTAY